MGSQDGGRALARALVLALAVFGWSAPGALAAPVSQGAAIERNLPPAPQANPTEIAPPEAPLASDDTTPLGPTLSGIVVLGPKDFLKSEPSLPVDTSDVERLDNPEAKAILADFIGKPISKKLVSDISAAIVLFYRAKGFPFVSVTTPPQEITTGVVQFRVVEFMLGNVAISGQRTTPDLYILKRLRVTSGAPIDANLLSQDLDELNRYPFRNIQVALAPSKEFGQTDLELAVTEVPPWRVFAGFSNSGSPTTGWERFSLGANVGSLLTQDSLLSYQFTSSTDFWFADGNPFGNAGHPHYVTHALTFEAPTVARQAIEFTFDAIATNAPSQAFEIGSRIYEASLGYRLALSDYMNAPGDFRFGLEAKREERSTYFGTTNVADAAIEVYQLYAGWTDNWADDWGSSSLDTSLHVSPGGLDLGNNDAAFAKFSNNAEHGAQYAYASATYSRYTGLPFNLGISTEILAQVASTRLPDTEQLGLGGMSLVRGYTLDDGAFDDAIIARNELRLPSFGFLQQLAAIGIPGGGTHINDDLAPYIFADIGAGSLRGAHHTANAGSVGLGADYNADGNISAGIAGAYAFEDALFTKSGDLRVEARVTISN